MAVIFFIFLGERSDGVVPDFCHGREPAGRPENRFSKSADRLSGSSSISTDFSICFDGKPGFHFNFFMERLAIRTALSLIKSSADFFGRLVSLFEKIHMAFSRGVGYHIGNLAVRGVARQPAPIFLDSRFSFCRSGRLGGRI